MDSGSDVTCVSKHLVDSSSYTGKATVLKSYKSSDASIRSPLAIVRLQVADFDKTVEVAVCDDMTDDILLGLNLGVDSLCKWLQDPPSLPENSARQTRAQALAHSEQEHSDSATLLASGATPHLLNNTLPFDDDLFV